MALAFDPVGFAEAWADAWNRRDVEEVLRHFSDDARFTSRVAVRLGFSPDGGVSGKTELRRYWTFALSRNPDLNFRVLSVFASVDTLIIRYVNQVGTERVEVLTFEDGLAVSGHRAFVCEVQPHMHDLLLVFAAYGLAAGSPGPSNMRIMATAMASGRGRALVLPPACSPAPVLRHHGRGRYRRNPGPVGGVMVVLKLACGLYLVFLGVRAGRAALKPDGDCAENIPAPPRARLFRQGLLMHLTNPKAVLGWTAIMSLVLETGSSPGAVPAILAGCFALGCLIFSGYAVVFSSRTAASAYRRARRWIERQTGRRVPARGSTNAGRHRREGEVTASAVRCFAADTVAMVAFSTAVDLFVAIELAGLSPLQSLHSGSPPCP